MNILRHPIYNFANLLTVFNLMLGFFSIICALNGKLDWSCYALFIAMTCDFLDGFVARLLGVNGDFGKQLDSLADIVSFGIAPGMLMFVMIIIGIDMEGLGQIIQNDQNCSISANQFAQIKIQEWSDVFFYHPKDNFIMNNPCLYGINQNPYDASIKYLPFISLIIPIFSILRLAKFNVDENQKDSFVGVPTPMSTFFFTFFPIYFVFHFTEFTSNSSFIFTLFDCYSLSAISIFVALLMMAPITLIALKFKSLKINENVFRYSLVGLSLISIPIFKLWSIPFILILYLGLSIVQRLINSKE